MSENKMMKDVGWEFWSQVSSFLMKYLLAAGAWPINFKIKGLASAKENLGNRNKQG